ncbi:MAG: tetratricopeptide repeat protein [Bacteroidales bacterium]
MRFTQSFKIFATTLLVLLLTNNLLAQTKLDKEKDSLLINGIKHYNNKNIDSSKLYFTKLLTADPKSDVAYYYMANLALQNNDTELGEMFLKKGIELDSTNYWYKNLLGQIYIKTNKIENAIEIYEKLITKYPKKTDNYYSLVNLYLNKQNIEKSNEILNKIEKISGQSEAIAMTRFNLFRMEQNWEGALKYLVNFDKEIQSPRIETIIADMYADRFRDTIAIEYYNKALAADPQYAPAMYGRAEVYRMKGNYVQFFKDINPFFANKFIDPQMKGEYIKQLFQTPNFIQRFRPQVDTIVMNFESANGSDSTSLSLIAAYYSQGGDQKKCLEILKRNSNLYPDSFDAMFQYVTYIYYIKDWEYLKKEAKSALEKYPNNTDLLQLIGIAQFQTKKIEEAINTYKQIEVITSATKDTVTLLSSYALLGDLYAEINNKTLAYNNYKKALKLDPNYNAVLNNYAYYLSLDGKKIKAAYEMSKKTIESEPDNPTYLDTFGWILYLMNKPIEAKAQFKHAMLYGGKDSAAILDHYAEVLYTLKEFDLAFIYWEQAKTIDKTLNIEAKIKLRREQIQK